MKTKKTKKSVIGYTLMICLMAVVGVVCWGFQQVPTAVGPIATVLGWIVMQIVSRVR
jgi:hypothetical protein